jgi:uncharacterized protein YaaQ
MKMVLSILPTNLSDLVSKELLDSGYRVTKFASTASLLSGGTTTLMIGVDDLKVEEVLEIIRLQVPPSEKTSPAHSRVTIYVLDIKDFDRVEV